jgi:hypothetical protein
MRNELNFNRYDRENFFLDELLEYARYMKGISHHAFEVLKPADVVGLLSIDAVVAERLKDLVVDTALVFEETVDAFEELVGKGFHLGASVRVGGEDIKTTLLGLRVRR